MAEKYLIWSNEHLMWWRENSRGYTTQLSDAGRYDRAEALTICANARDGWSRNGTPSEIPVQEYDALMCLKLARAEKRDVRAQ